MVQTAAEALAAEKSGVQAFDIGAVEAVGSSSSGQHDPIYGNYCKQAAHPSCANCGHVPLHGILDLGGDSPLKCWIVHWKNQFE